MARSRRRGSTVLPLNATRAASQRSQGRPSVASSLASQKRPSLEGDLAAAVAPQQSVLGSGPLGTLTPSVESYAPEGGADTSTGTQLIDALAQEPAPIEVSGPSEVGGGPFGAATGGPFGGTSGNPEADAALIGAESMYGTPGNESPLAAATQSSMLGSSPGSSLFDIVPGYEAPNGETSESIAAYNRNKLLRMLMEEGY